MPRQFRRKRLPYTTRKVAKYAKRSTGARAQSKQIASLSRQISKVAEISSVPLELRWQRSNMFVDRVALGAANSGQLTKYVCPIPVAPDQVAIVDDPNFGDTGPNTALNNMDFKKAKIWVTSTDANQKPRCTHRGGYLTYKLARTNFSLRFITVMLVRTKPAIADQLSLQRAFQFFDDATVPPTVAGQNSRLVEGYDYIHNPITTILDPITGIQMNPQMWDVLGKHTYKFGTNKPFLRPELSPESLANTIGNTMRTDATGYFKLPAGGAVHKIWSSDHTQQATNLDYKNQRSEKNVFLVIFAQRGSMIPSTEPGGTQPVADLPLGELKMSMQVRDNYTCSEGSLTPQTGTGMGRAHVARKRRRRQ